ncbi:MAG: hypothetical protein JNK23_03820 [Opitutaceae bacterium]|nr:hypothetical protein [Opitutaceae bacterium]
MRSIALFGLGLGFLLMGAGLFALTLRKPAKPAPANPNAKQQRELAVLAEEKKKMHIAAACAAGFGVALMGVSFL